MSRIEKLIFLVLQGANDQNISFSDLQRLLVRLGFECRIRGDHYIYTNINVSEIINIQPKKNMAKPYQVRQVREIIIKYKLGGIKDEQI